jgi:ribonuclease HII
MKENEENRLKKLYEFEEDHYQRGYELICGIDEVGRGPLAGPVVAACVILPKGSIIEGINDSKKIPKKRHKELYDKILSVCIDHSIGIVDELDIDSINILNSTIKAMERAVDKLKVRPDFLFIDYLKLDNVVIPQLSISKGDSLSASIAAASIVAKYTRDEMMKEFSKIYTVYGFEKNAGYGTQEHLDAIRKYGLCPIHRKTFTKKYCNIL